MGRFFDTQVNSQAGKPPPNTLEFVWPNARNVKRARGEENTAWVSYLGRRQVRMSVPQAGSGITGQWGVTLRSRNVLR